MGILDNYLELLLGNYHDSVYDNPILFIIIV